MSGLGGPQHASYGARNPLARLSPSKEPVHYQQPRPGAIEQALRSLQEEKNDLLQRYQEINSSALMLQQQKQALAPSSYSLAPASLMLDSKQSGRDNGRGQHEAQHDFAGTSQSERQDQAAEQDPAWHEQQRRQKSQQADSEGAEKGRRKEGSLPRMPPVAATVNKRQIDMS